MSPTSSWQDAVNNDDSDNALVDVLRNRGGGGSPAPSKRGKQPATSSGPADEPTTRSWYLARSVAEELSEACDELFYDLRGAIPKHVILSHLIREGLRHKTKVREKLTKTVS
ncbi:hypothetical protein ACFQ68_13390 [Amycolatopsis japonica]|uniref:hypothetical protein n=1 Tax=Amycolatopsis japonica TaxID=208439 RepID=UPI00367351A6